MKKSGFLLVVLAMLMTGQVVQAQEIDEMDSVLVVGSVINQYTRQPESYCMVYFIREDEPRLSVMTDEDGLFAIRSMPVGKYTLELSVRGHTLHREELVLNTNTDLNIAVITDTIRLVYLPEVNVNESRPKNTLAKQGLLITSARDLRLKHFNYRWWIPWYQGEAFGAPASQMAR